MPFPSSRGQVAEPLTLTVAIDDDPTGVQAMAGIDVLLDWSVDQIREAVVSSPAALHVVTNSRALAPAAAYELVRSAAAAIREALPAARLVLRGDSTLRAHLVEEYLAVRDVSAAGSGLPLLLVPALPAAGRVTLGGVHYLRRAGIDTPLHETEYACDGVFAYRDSRLLVWAEQRSQGLLAAARGIDVPLARLRATGPGAVTAALLGLVEQGFPAVCAPDAETVDDLELIADGLRGAEATGAAIVTRCAPAFAAVLAGSFARESAVPPPAPRGLLVICGSYVPATTRQLATLLAARPGSLVEVDVNKLVTGDADVEIERAASVARRLLAETRFAVVATPRGRAQAAYSLDAGERIARALAWIAGRAAPAASAVLAKGGITSAVTARDGLGAFRARVLGPVVPGVSLWSLERRMGPALPYLVFPGNVGDDGTLAEVVDLVLAA